MATLWEIGLANALVVAIAAPAAWLMMKVAKRPALAHAVWVVLLIKLIVPPLAKVSVPWGRSLPMAMVPTEINVPDEVASPPFVENAASSPVLVVPADVSLPPIPVSSPTPRAVAPRWSPSWPALLGSVWLGGSALWLLMAGWRIARFGRVIGRAEEAPAELTDWVAELASQIGLRRPPRVVMAPGRVSPMVWALGGRACLLVPESLWSRLDQEQRASLLVHELAHLKRKDHWVRLIELLATGLYWWHPALWLARRELHRAEEACCDSWVVWAMPKAKRTYASALVEAVEFLSVPRSPRLPVGASGMGQVEDLSRRIGMIMRGDTPRGPGRAGVLMVAALGLFLIPWQPIQAQDGPKGQGDERQEAAGKAADEAARRADDEDELLRRVQAKIESYKKAPASIAPGEAAELMRALERLARSAEMSRKGFVSRAQVFDDLVSLNKAEAQAANERLDRDVAIQEAKDKVEIATARLRTQESRTEKARAQVMLAEAQASRLSRLHAAGNSDASELEKAHAELQIAKAGLMEAQSEQAIAKLEVSQAQRMAEALARRAQAAKVAADNKADRGVNGTATDLLRLAAEKADRGSYEGARDLLRLAVEKAQAERDMAAAAAAQTEKLHDKKVVSAAEVDHARGVLRVADVALKEAQTRAAMGPPANAPARDTERRMDELESKLNRILRELEAIRNEKEQEKKRAPNTQTSVDPRFEVIKSPVFEDLMRKAKDTDISNDRIAKDLYKALWNRDPSKQELEDAAADMTRNGFVRMDGFARVFMEMAPQWNATSADALADLLSVDSKQSTEQLVNRAYRAIYKRPATAEERKHELDLRDLRKSLRELVTTLIRDRDAVAVRR